MSGTKPSREISGVPAWSVTFKTAEGYESYRVEAWKKAKAIRLASAFRRNEAKRLGKSLLPVTQVFANRAPSVSAAEVLL